MVGSLPSRSNMILVRSSCPRWLIPIVRKVHEVFHVAALAEIPFPFERIRGGQCGGDAQKHNEVSINGTQPYGGYF